MNVEQIKALDTLLEYMLPDEEKHYSGEPDHIYRSIYTLMQYRGHDLNGCVAPKETLSVTGDASPHVERTMTILEGRSVYGILVEGIGTLFDAENMSGGIEEWLDAWTDVMANCRTVIMFDHSKIGIPIGEDIDEDGNRRVTFYQP